MVLSAKGFTNMDRAAYFLATEINMLVSLIKVVEVEQAHFTKTIHFPSEEFG